MRRMYSKPQLLEAVEQESKLNGIKVFENIVDKDGHKRFLEDDLKTIEKTGVEVVYGKWSLSGTHLLIVLAINVTNGTAMSYSTFAQAIPPQWVMDKIYPVVGQLVIRGTFTAFDSSYGTQNQVVNLQKSADGKNIDLQFSPLTYSADRTLRVQFDLLIDND